MQHFAIMSYPFLNAFQPFVVMVGHPVNQIWHFYHILSTF